MKKSILIILFLSFVNIAFSQWEPLGGPYGGSINDLQQNEFFQFASTGNGLYKSIDSGRTWERLLIGIGSSYSSNSIGIHQNQIVVYAWSSISGERKGYLLRSDDNGNSWIQINKPEADNNIYNLAINAYGIYISDNRHLWVSTDQGLTWNYSSLNAGRGLSQYNEQIYVSVYHTIFQSSIDADEWSEIEVDGMTSAINNFQVFDSIFLVTDEYGKLLISDDGGESWSYSLSPSYWGAPVVFIKLNDLFYGYRFGNILKSENKGLTWDSIGTESGITKMILAGDTIIAGTYGQGILRSTNLGVSFKSFNSILDASDVNAMDVDQKYLWTGSSFNGVSRQQKSTNTWDTILLPATLTLQDIKSLDDRIFVIKDRYNIYRSDNEGTSWSSITPTLNGPAFSKLYIDGHVIFAGWPSGLAYSNLFISYDYGDNWLPDTFRINNKLYWPSMIARTGSIVFTADSYNIFRSSDNTLSWEKLNDGYTLTNCTCFIIDLEASEDILFVTIQDIKVSSIMTYFSRDQGDTWEFLETGFPIEGNINGFKFETDVNNILIATGSFPEYGIYISRDQAVTWQHFDEGLIIEHVNEIISDDEYLYAATSGKGVWRRKISDLSTTAIQYNALKQNFSVYPIPSNGNFTLKFNSNVSADATLIVTDLNGKICLIRDIDLDYETEIETTTLPTGLYFLSIRTGEKFFTGKLVIQK